MKVCQPMSANERNAPLSIWQIIDLQNMRIAEASDSFYVCVSVKASKHELISNSALSRKREHPNYKSSDNYFQGDGKSMESGHIRIYQRMISE